MCTRVGAAPTGGAEFAVIVLQPRRVGRSKWAGKLMYRIGQPVLILVERQAHAGHQSRGFLPFAERAEPGFERAKKRTVIRQAPEKKV